MPNRNNTSTLKVGIIENDLLIAESILVALQSIGYHHTQPARNYTDALTMIKAEAPDLLLIDIMLDGEKDGIDLAATVNSDYGIPFIFLTANSDSSTVNRAKEVKPYAYLVKPFNESDLYSTIEIAFSNYNRQSQIKAKLISTKAAPRDFIFIKDEDLFRKVKLSELLYIESRNVYLHLHTHDKEFVIRAKLEDFLAEFPVGVLYKIHKSFAINLKHLDTITSGSVQVNGVQIPLQKSYRHDFLIAINAVQ